MAGVWDFCGCAGSFDIYSFNNFITKTVGALYEFMTILYKQNKYAMLHWDYIAFLTDKHYENACKLHTNHFVN